MQSITLIIKVGFAVICVAVVLNNVSCITLLCFYEYFLCNRGKQYLASLSQLNLLCCIYWEGQSTAFLFCLTERDISDSVFVSLAL